MKCRLFCFFLLAFGLKIYAQDTICFTNQTKTAAIVKKITPAEVEYLKFNNPNGLVIVESKSVIKYIRYQDGSVDSVMVYPLPTSTHYYEFKSISDKIFLERNNLLYKSVVLNNQNLKILIKSYPFETTKIELDLKRKKARKQKNISLIFAGTGIISAYGTVLGLSAFGKNQGSEETVVLASAASVFVCSTLFYIHFRKKEVKAKKELVELYNAMK